MSARACSVANRIGSAGGGGGGGDGGGWAPIQPSDRLRYIRAETSNNPTTASDCKQSMSLAGHLKIPKPDRRTRT